jgi:N6-L-threonylcarbamoyladenine synthase
MSDMWTREKLWQTQDDAAGEAFDKVAKMMWLWYPGGPIVSRLADEYTWESSKLFPRVFLEKSEFWFSFSGLKSAVKREVDKRKTPPHPLSTEGEANSGEQRELTLEDQKELSYEFQNAVNEVLCYKLIRAAQDKGVTTILLAGWVSANNNLNERIKGEAKKNGLQFFAPIKKLYCMDNAAMIGILAYYRIKYNQFEYQIWEVKVGSW